MKLRDLLSGGDDQAASAGTKPGWRNRFRVIGKFRDASFAIEGHEHAFGRRNEVHEFPQRDKPHVTDLGRKAHEFTLDLFVIGSNYDIERNKLINALCEPGPGTLVHPYYGTLRVSVLSARARESTSSAGGADFTVTFVEDEGVSLKDSVADDTGSVCRNYVDKSLVAAIKDFGEKFSVLYQADDFVQSVINELDATLAAAEKVVGDVTGSISALIRAPAEMAALIAGTINNIANMLDDPVRAISIYRTMFSAGGGASAAVPLTTDNRKQQANNLHQVQQLVRRVAVIEAVRSSSVATFAARDDAVMLRTQLADAIDVLTEVAHPVTAAPVSDEVYVALVDMRAAMAKDLAIRGARLPELKQHTPRATLPALVLAYQLYGDARRDAEIVARNNVARPGFVRGGKVLEVLGV